MSKTQLRFDSKIIDEIILEEEYKKILSCIQCGTCTASCPSGRWSPLRTHKIIRKAQTGLESVLSDEDIWLCTTCFNCLERCIRKIPVTEILIKLRNIACENGFMPYTLRAVVKNLLEQGHAVPLGDSNSIWIKLRKELDLNPIPPTIEKNLQKKLELDKIIDAIKFKLRIPYR